MSGVKVNGVDLEQLRKHVNDGYNPSSATILALIQVALREPALIGELACERYVAQRTTEFLAEIAAARVSLDQDAVIRIVDNIIKKCWPRMSLCGKGKVH